MKDHKNTFNVVIVNRLIDDNKCTAIDFYFSDKGIMR